MIMRLVRKPLIGIGEIAVEPAQSDFLQPLLPELIFGDGCPGGPLARQ